MQGEKCQASQGSLVSTEGGKALLSRKELTQSEEELQLSPRSRSPCPGRNLHTEIQMEASGQDRQAEREKVLNLAPGGPLSFGLWKPGCRV